MCATPSSACIETGEYSDIAVDATLGAAGVKLKFITKPAYFHWILRRERSARAAQRRAVAGGHQAHSGRRLTYLATPPLRWPASPICSSETASTTPASSPPYRHASRPRRSTSIFTSIPVDRARFDGLVASGDTLRPHPKADRVQRLEAIPRMVWAGLASAHRNAPSKRPRQHSLLVSQARPSARAGDAGEPGLSVPTSTPSRPILAINPRSAGSGARARREAFVRKAAQPAAYL